MKQNALSAIFWPLLKTTDKKALVWRSGLAALLWDIPVFKCQNLWFRIQIMQNYQMKTQHVRKIYKESPIN